MHPASSRESIAALIASGDKAMMARAADTLEYRAASYRDLFGWPRLCASLEADAVRLRQIAEAMNADRTA